MFLSVTLLTTHKQEAHTYRERGREIKTRAVFSCLKKSSSCFVAVVTNRNGLPDLKNVNTDCTPVCVYPITTQP